MVIIDMTPNPNKLLHVYLDIEKATVGTIIQMLYDNKIITEKQIPILYSPHFSSFLKREKKLKDYKIKDKSQLTCSVS